MIRPLSKGRSEKVIKRNVQRLINEGYGWKPAYAIAYKKAGKYRPR
jgi:hypothetical protein